MLREKCFARACFTWSHLKIILLGSNSGMTGVRRRYEMARPNLGRGKITRKERRPVKARMNSGDIAQKKKSWGVKKQKNCGGGGAERGGYRFQT